MKITYKQIMGFKPCYDPIEIGMLENYEAEIKDFIVEYRGKVKNLENIIWISVRKEFFNDRDLRLFGVWSTLQVKNLMKDQRSLDSLEISEKFAFGEATEGELDAARTAAAEAAEAAEAAARDAARDASAAAWAAAWAASAASAAAWAASAASDAASDAAWAASDAAWAASAAAWAAARVAAAWDAARVAQIEILLKMIEKPNGEWFKEWKEQQ